MKAVPTYVSTAEAAYIAEVSDRDVNRAIDEHIVPASLLELTAGRRISRLAAALIAFYNKTDEIFTASLRKRALNSFVEQVNLHGDLSGALTLKISKNDRKTELAFQFVQHEVDTSISIDFSKYVDLVLSRSLEVERATESVTVSDEVMEGLPVFRGTRVPIDTVLGSIERGVDLARLRESYPFLTEELINNAKIYALVRPRRGRPRRIGEVHPSWKESSRKIVRAASK